MNNKLIEEKVNVFEDNFLDGDKIEDCGKAMICVDEDFIDYLRTSLLSIYNAGRRNMKDEALRILTDEINLAHKGEVGGITSRLTSAWNKISALN